MKKIRIRSYLLAGLALFGLSLFEISCSRQTPPANQNAAAPSPSPSGSESVQPSTSPSQDAAQSENPSTSPGGAAGSFETPAAPSGTGSAKGSGSTIAQPPPPPPPPRVFTLPAGSNLSIFTTHEVSTKTAKPGDTFNATLGHSIRDKDWLVAKQGAPVEGVVVSSDPGGRVKGVASISVELRRMTLADGRIVPVTTRPIVVKAKKTIKKDAAKIGIGAGIGAVIGAIAGGRKGAAIGAGAGGGAGTAYVLATRGDPARIPAESHLNFRTTAPIRVTERIP